MASPNPRQSFLLSPALAPLRAVRRWLILHYDAILEALQDTWWNRIVLSRAMPHPWRMGLYRLHPRMHLGKNVNLRSQCLVEKNTITIGDETFVNRGVEFCGESAITIGRDCGIGYETMFVTGTHFGFHEDRRFAGRVELPIIVGNGVWIGARAIILPGTTIGDGCIIAAGAVVRGECAAHGLYGGVPAKRLKDLAKGRMYYEELERQGAPYFGEDRRREARHNDHY